MIEVRGCRDNGTLKLRVQDNGSGLQEERNGSHRQGVGLANTRARLEQLYGPNHTFTIHNAETGGVIADLWIPASDSPAGGARA